MNNTAMLFQDSDKNLIMLLLIMLMREKADKGLILALFYILFV